jgi:hypothetical protein
MAEMLLGPALSLPSLLSTAFSEQEETDYLDQDNDFTPMVERRDSHRLGHARHVNEDADLYEEQSEGDVSGDDPPSMTLREILLNADTSHFHLLGLSIFLFPDNY